VKNGFKVNAKDFSGWIPIRVYRENLSLMVDWGYLGTRRFTKPFFNQTVDECVRHPADTLFRHQTPLEQLGEIMSSQPGVPPTGFIFHMSRCGSTLISQMLAAVPENIVLSEPAPLDTILRAHFQNPEITEEERVRWLQWLVGTWAWRRQPAEKNLFIKFDSWHTPFLPLIQRAFPGVPWIFVYREPLEVMVSQSRRRGGHVIPGALEPQLFGWEPAMTAQMSLLEYGARVLANICGAALTHIQGGNGKLVNYRQLPDSIWPALMDYWQLKFSPDATTSMIAAARMDARNPKLTFQPDAQAKIAMAAPELRALTHQWLDDIYQQLESGRRRRGFAGQHGD
jgi:hypothetical protein